jgi:hypothetical protein
MCPTVAADKARILRQVLDLAERGWSVFPLLPNTKMPAVKWKRFQDERPSQKQLRSWFIGGDQPGLAVVLGGISGGLACRDFDAMEGYQKWAADHAGLASVLPTVQTARGRHVYFRGEAEAFVKFDDGELRADHRHYNALPPSIHPSGKPYQWLTPLEDNLPLIPLDIFLPPSGVGPPAPIEDSSPLSHSIACVPCRS